MASAMAQCVAMKRARRALEWVNMVVLARRRGGKRLNRFLRRPSPRATLPYVLLTIGRDVVAEDPARARELVVGDVDHDERFRKRSVGRMPHRAGLVGVERF